MDTLKNFSDASMVSGTSSVDIIVNYGNNATVDGGAGNDSIINDRDSVIELVNDNGLIRYRSHNVEGKYSSINGGIGNDIIVDKAGYSTVLGGRGNDTVTLGAYSVYEYIDGDGNDLITNFSADKILYIPNSEYFTVNSGKDVIVKVGAGKITLQGAQGTPIRIVGANESLPAMPIFNYTPHVVGTAKNDTLYAQNPNVTVEGLGGNDVIVNNSNLGTNAVLLGGSGNDSISNGGRGVTVGGGKGNDLVDLYGSEQIIVYNVGDGNDTVLGFGASDKIQLADGTDYTVDAVDSDTLVFVGSGSILLKDVAAQNVSVDNNEPEPIIDPDSGWEIATSKSDKISYNRKTYTLTVKDGFTGEVNVANFKYAVSKVDASNVSGNVKLVGNTKAVVLNGSKGGSTVEGGEGNDKLNGNSGADLFVYNVGAGQDVIGSTKSTENLYQAQDSIIIVSDNYFGLDDLTIKDSKNAVIVTFDDDKKSKLTINRDDIRTPIRFYFGTTSDTAIERGSFMYGELPEGVSYVDNGSFNRLTIDESFDGDVINAAAINSQLLEIDASSIDGSIALLGNDKANVLKASKGGSVLDGGSGNDQLYGSEAQDTFVFTVQPKGKKNVIYNYDSSDRIMIDTSLLDLDDEVPSFDADRSLITYNGAKDNFNGFNDAKNDVTVTLNKKNVITIKNAAGKAINFVDTNGVRLGTFGHILSDGLKYNAKRTGIEVEDVDAVNVGAALDINLSNEGDYENAYFASVVNVDLTGVGVAASIVGNAKNNILRAGDLYTELHGGAGNDQYYGTSAEGAGVDFYYSSGKDVIYGFESDKDYVYISGDTSLGYDDLSTVTGKSFVEKGNDVVLNINAKNSITFKGDIGKVIEVFDYSGALDGGAGYIRYDYTLPEGLEYNGLKRTAIDVIDSDTLIEHNRIEIDLTNETNKELFTFASTVKKVDLSGVVAENFSANLVGNDLPNELHAPNGGVNELYGGHQEFANPKKAKASSDKLYGGAGEDVFVYGVGDGKDQIIGYGAGDVVWLDDTYGAIESMSITDKKNVVTVVLNGDAKNTLTITKTDVNQAIEFRGSATEINGLREWSASSVTGFRYGADEDHMVLSDDGTTLSVTGDENDYIAVDAKEINTQLKVLDGRSASGAFVELTGNGNNNVLHAGTNGSILNGGCDAVKVKSTDDAMHGNAGEDRFEYEFGMGLGGKDTIYGFSPSDDYVSMDAAPKSVTTNGKNVVFAFEGTFDGKSRKGTLTVNGNSVLNSNTVMKIEIDGRLAEYRFSDGLKNADWLTSEGITSTVIGGDDTTDGVDGFDDTLGGQTLGGGEVDEGYWFTELRVATDDELSGLITEKVEAPASAFESGIGLDGINIFDGGSERVTTLTGIGARKKK